jgi:hypothetical protein
MGRLPRSRPKRETRARKSARSRPGSTTPSPPPRPRGASRQAPPEARPGPIDRSEHAPGLPRLALDGAIEAAKLPIKVGANLTFRALDAVAKNLRRR